MKTLHEALAEIKLSVENKTLTFSYGICGVIADVPLNAGDYAKLRSLIKLWPEHSGNLAYPVSHPTLGPIAAYVGATCTEMWYEGEYAAARIRLLDFLIEQTNENITPIPDSGQSQSQP